MNYNILNVIIDESINNRISKPIIEIEHSTLS